METINDRGQPLTSASDALEFLMGTKNDSESALVNETKNDNASDNEVLQTDCANFISETL